MPALKIKCPSCNKITGTGIALGENTIFRAENFRSNSTQCMNCGQMVSWNGEDVINKDEFAHP